LIVVLCDVVWFSILKWCSFVVNDYYAYHFDFVKLFYRHADLVFNFFSKVEFVFSALSVLINAFFYDKNEKINKFSWNINIGLGKPYSFKLTNNSGCVKK